ncbi:hypothetical protein Droror1_Dr00003159 [Drosera rotundifolia]
MLHPETPLQNRGNCSSVHRRTPSSSLRHRRVQIRPETPRKRSRGGGERQVWGPGLGGFGVRGRGRWWGGVHGGGGAGEGLKEVPVVILVGQGGGRVKESVKEEEGRSRRWDRGRRRGGRRGW